MDIELAEKVYELIKADRIEEAIQISEEKLKQLPETDFNKLIGWDQSQNAEEVADYLNTFFKSAIKSIKKVEAIYAEMNAFTINYDGWYLDFFAFKKFQGYEDLDWLADYDYHNEDMTIGFLDIDDILAVFRDYMENEKWNDSVEESAFEIAEILVILRLHQVFKETLKKGLVKNYTWTKVPFLITAHDYDLIYNVTRC